jgi:hypothetical protein
LDGKKVAFTGGLSLRRAVAQKLARKAGAIVEEGRGRDVLIAAISRLAGRLNRSERNSSTSITKPSEDTK